MRHSPQKRTIHKVSRSGYSIEEAIRQTMVPVMVPVCPCRLVYGVFDSSSFA